MLPKIPVDTILGEFKMNDNPNPDHGLTIRAIFARVALHPVSEQVPLQRLIAPLSEAIDAMAEFPEKLLYGENVDALMNLLQAKTNDKPEIRSYVAGAGLRKIIGLSENFDIRIRNNLNDMLKTEEDLTFYAELDQALKLIEEKEIQRIEALALTLPKKDVYL